MSAGQHLGAAGLDWLRQYFVDTYNADWSSAYQLELVGDVPDEVLQWAGIENATPSRLRLVSP